MSAVWPATQPVDIILVKSSNYLMDVAHEFRKRLKDVTESKKVLNSVMIEKYVCEL